MCTSLIRFLYIFIYISSFSSFANQLNQDKFRGLLKSTKLCLLEFITQKWYETKQNKLIALERKRFQYSNKLPQTGVGTFHFPSFSHSAMPLPFSDDPNWQLNVETVVVPLLERTAVPFSTESSNSQVSVITRRLQVKYFISLHTPFHINLT